MMSLKMTGLDPVLLVRAFSVLLWKFRWSCQWLSLWCLCFDWNQVNGWFFSVGFVCTKRSRVQRWSTHRIILAPKILIYHFVSTSFKFNFKIIVFLCLRTAHYMCCSFTNIISRKDPVGAICRSSASVSGDED